MYKAEPPKFYRLEYRIFQSFSEVGMSAARERKRGYENPVREFLQRIPQVPDQVLTLLRFEAFLDGWNLTIKFDNEELDNERETNQGLLGHVCGFAMA